MSYLKHSLFNEQMKILTLWGENDDNEPPFHHVSIRCKVGRFEFNFTAGDWSLEDARMDLLSQFTGFCRALHLEYSEQDIASYFPDFPPKEDIPF